MTRTSRVSPVRPSSGWEASRLVGATPGWARLLVIPQPAARLRRLEFETEQAAGDLGLPVGAHDVVAAFAVQVVPVDRSAARGDADLRGHPGPTGPEQRQQLGGQREVARDGWCRTAARTRRPWSAAGRGHHAGVVDQQVDRCSPPYAAGRPARRPTPARTGPASPGRSSPSGAGRGSSPPPPRPWPGCGPASRPRRRPRPAPWRCRRPTPSLAPVTIARSRSGRELVVSS